MAVQGAYFEINLAKLKVLNGTVNLSSDTFHIVLCTSAQGLSPTFTGTSGNAQYSDLTNELTTANGYTAGGIVMPSTTLTLSGGTVTFGAGNPTWTLTGGGITFKYAAIVDWTATNKDIVFYCDMDTSGGSVSPIAGALQIQTNASGIGVWV